MFCEKCLYFILIVCAIILSNNVKIWAQNTDFGIKANTGVHGLGFYTDLQFCYFNTNTTTGIIHLPEKLISIGAGLETNYFFKQDFRLVPKVSFDYHLPVQVVPLSFGLQTRFYPAKDMDYKNISVQLCPQVGTNLFGLGFVTLGYSIGVSNRDITPDLGFQVNMGINLPFHLN